MTTSPFPMQENPSHKKTASIIVAAAAFLAGVMLLEFSLLGGWDDAPTNPPAAILAVSTPTVSGPAVLGVAVAVPSVDLGTVP